MVENVWKHGDHNNLTEVRMLEVTSTGTAPAFKHSTTLTRQLTLTSFDFEPPDSEPHLETPESLTHTTQTDRILELLTHIQLDTHTTMHDLDQVARQTHLAYNI